MKYLVKLNNNKISKNHYQIQKCDNTDYCHDLCATADIGSCGTSGGRADLCVIDYNDCQGSLDTCVYDGDMRPD